MTSKPRPAPSDETLAPGLYVVATPIGHASDISLRALATLKGADLIACEDTRVTRKLLDLHGIRRRLLAYHAHNEVRASEEILRRLGDGERVALVSDAGTPLLSDPGERLLGAAIAAGLPVTVVPGPSAILAGLVLSGLPTTPFHFEGFLPAKGTARRAAIERLADTAATLVLFEAPHRVGATLAELAARLGPRPAALARELTKLFEEVQRAPLDRLAAAIAARGAPKGEIVLIIAPPPHRAQSEVTDAEIDAEIAARAAGGLPLPRLAAEIAEALGLPRRRVYERCLAARAEAEEPEDDGDTPDGG